MQTIIIIRISSFTKFSISEKKSDFKLLFLKKLNIYS